MTTSASSSGLALLCGMACLTATALMAVQLTASMAASAASSSQDVLGPAGALIADLVGVATLVWRLADRGLAGCSGRVARALVALQTGSAALLGFALAVDVVRTHREGSAISPIIGVRLALTAGAKLAMLAMAIVTLATLNPPVSGEGKSVDKESGLLAGKEGSLPDCKKGVVVDV